MTAVDIPSHISTCENYYDETYGSKESGMSEIPNDHIVDTSKMVFSKTEISDKEIEEVLFHQSNEYAYGFKDAIKWYREKIKLINDKTNR